VTKRRLLSALFLPLFSLSSLVPPMPFGLLPFFASLPPSSAPSSMIFTGAKVCSDAGNGAFVKMTSGAGVGGTGAGVGSLVGTAVGAAVGAEVGSLVGAAVGSLVGASVVVSSSGSSPIQDLQPHFPATNSKKAGIHSSTVIKPIAPASWSPSQLTIG